MEESAPPCTESMYESSAQREGEKRGFSGMKYVSRHKMDIQIMLILVPPTHIIPP